MGAREERIAQNEERFRTANDRLVAQRNALEFGRSDRTPFVCECGDPTCVRVVALSLDEYEGVRADPDTFFVMPGHEDAATETVEPPVASAWDRFLVVRKRPAVRA